MPERRLGWWCGRPTKARSPFASYATSSALLAMSRERSPPRGSGGTGTSIKVAPPVRVGPRSGRKRHRRERRAALLLELAHAVAQARRSEKSLSVAILTPHFLSDRRRRGARRPLLGRARPHSACPRRHV